MGQPHYTKDNPVNLSLPLRSRDAGDDDPVILDADGKLVCGMHSADGYRHQLRQVIRACNNHGQLITDCLALIAVLDAAKLGDAASVLVVKSRVSELAKAQGRS